MGKMDWRMVEREWEWPPVADSLDISGLCTIKEYIQRQQTTIMAHISYRTIYELCMEVGKMPGSS